MVAPEDMMVCFTLSRLTGSFKPLTFHEKIVQFVLINWGLST
jgi:hypothetical protein